MSEVKVFDNPEFGKVRALDIGGETWFVGKDIAEILGYANPRKALADHVEDEDKTYGVTICDAMGREQKPVCINESGLYGLVLGSKMAGAKKFKRWVTAEVLPSIRRHGMYAIDDLIDNPELGIRALTALKEERARRKALEIEADVLHRRVEIMEPKVSYYDLVLQCKDLLSTTEIAKDYGMSAKAMNQTLKEIGVQYCQAGVWFLYAKYQANGYTQTRTQSYEHADGSRGARLHTYWTQKGRRFIYELLKQKGVLPVIERQVPEKS